jgi:hypothetical protein
MATALGTTSHSEFRLLMSGRSVALRGWIEAGEIRALVLCLVAVLIGSGLYGAAMGSWRSPLQGLFVALKFPLILLLTTLGNALLNSMLAPLLGLRITLRESLLAILMSFAIAGAVLGAFSPIAAFITWNCPPMHPDRQLSGGAYSLLMLTHVVVIAFAGVVGTLRLSELLRSISPGPAVARRVLFAWLATNLFLGSQLSWILRPFIGSPILPVQFIRETALEGNFYETVFSSLMRLIGAK